MRGSQAVRFPWAPPVGHMRVIGQLMHFPGVVQCRCGFPLEACRPPNSQLHWQPQRRTLCVLLPGPGALGTNSANDHQP